jgi:hypothetical protein
LKQARGVKRLQSRVDLGCIEPLAGTQAEIGTDGIGFDAAVALHDDIRGGLGKGGGSRR